MLTYLFGVILSGVIWYIIARKVIHPSGIADLVVWFILTAISWVGVGLAVVGLCVEGIERLQKRVPNDYWDNLAERFFKLGQKKDK